MREECENSNLSAQKLKEELEALKSRYESGLNVIDNVNKIGTNQGDQGIDEVDKERAERRRKKREVALQDVLKKLEKLTIGGEEIGNAELKKRREKRRKKLEALVGALGANDANGSVFQVYGQLRFVNVQVYCPSKISAFSLLLFYPFTQIYRRCVEEDGKACETIGSRSGGSSSILGRRAS